VGMIALEWEDIPRKAEVYTPEEICLMFGVKRRTVLSWCRSPARRELLGAFQPGGGCWRFRMSAVDTYRYKMGMMALTPLGAEEDVDGSGEAA